MDYLLFHIDNFRGRFILMIALNFGGRGGCPPASYMPISATAFPKLTGISEWDFEFEPQAQNALADFKAWLKAREERWNKLRREAYEASSPFIQAYKKACAELKP